MSSSFDRLRHHALGLVVFAAVGGLVAGAGWAASASMRSTSAPVAAPVSTAARRSAVTVLAGSVPNRAPSTTAAPSPVVRDAVDVLAVEVANTVASTTTTSSVPATTAATTTVATTPVVTAASTTAATLPPEVAKGTTVATARPATPVGTVPSATRKVVGVGDSIMFGATPALKDAVTGELSVDAKVGRSFAEGLDVVKELQKQKALGDVVVVHLGTNNGATVAQVRQMLDRLKSVRTVLLVNVRVPRDWQDATNANLASVARSYRNTRLVDWYSATDGHPELFASDGYHLTNDGAAFYATLIADAMNY